MHKHTLTRIALSTLLATACTEAVDEPDLAPLAEQHAAVIASGRPLEVNYRHQTCSITNISGSAGGMAVTIVYSLACEDGTHPNVSRSRRIADGYALSGFSYDRARYQYSVTVCANPRGDCRGTLDRRTFNDDLITSINESVEQFIWDDAATALANVNAPHVYDRGNLSLRVYDENPAFPFQNGQDVQPDDFPHVTARVRYSPDPRYVADIYVLPSTRAGSGFLDNPLIVGDAFDPGNDRHLPQLYTKPEYRKMLSTNPAEKGPRTGPNARDIVFVDFSQGAGDLFINAQLLLRAIEWVESRSRNEVIVGGISMSGVLARIALIYSMPLNNTGREDLGKRVRGFISVDAPQLGASVAPRLQQISCAFSEHRWLPDSEGCNSAVGNWKEIRSPGARQMLFGMYERRDGETRCGYSNTHAEVNAGFYARINQMATTAYGDKRRGFRGDIPSVGIAYSNFYRPHGALDLSVARRVGKIDPPVADRRYMDLGGAGDPSRFEFYPGSAGDWFWSSLKRSSPKYVTTDNIAGEKFKGTFIPLHSALALSPAFDPLAPPTLDEREIARYSAFDAVYYMKNDFNRYECEIKNNCGFTPGINERRYQHMVFDEQLLTAMQNAIADVLAMPRRQAAYSRSYNDDTAADLAFFEPGNNTMHVSLSRSNGFGGAGSGAWASTGSYGRLAGNYLPGDFDGDGRMDMGYLGPDNAIQVLWANGRSFGGPGSGQWMPANGFGGSWGRHFVGDFNGDGKTDLAYGEGDGSFHVTFSTGSSFSYAGRWIPPGQLGADPRWYIGDYNGDGRDDLGFFRASDLTFHVAYSQREGFAESSMWVGPNGFGWNPDNFYPADYDGDGRTDLGYQETGDNSFHVTISTGVGFSYAGRWIGPNEFGHSGGRYYVSQTRRR